MGFWFLFFCQYGSVHSLLMSGRSSVSTSLCTGTWNLRCQNIRSCLREAFSYSSIPEREVIFSNRLAFKRLFSLQAQSVCIQARLSGLVSDHCFFFNFSSGRLVQISTLSHKCPWLSFSLKPAWSLLNIPFGTLVMAHMPRAKVWNILCRHWNRDSSIWTVYRRCLDEKIKYLNYLLVKEMKILLWYIHNDNLLGFSCWVSQIHFFSAE